MRNLPTPMISSKDKFDRIANSKNRPYKGRLARVKAVVKQRYDEYDHHENKLENLSASTITGLSADALIKCYTSKTNELSTLRDELLYPDVADFDKCPFCGINEPDTLDHYLPKEDFPEFSVLAKNLIPICGTCNSHYKGRSWIMNGQRLFIHTYFDIFPDKYFLNAKVTVDRNVSIDFSSNSVRGESYFSRLFDNHFTKLSLNERYRRKAAAEIFRKKKSLERIFSRSGAPRDVANSLREEAAKLEGEYSKNHWKPVLYNALSNSVDFCNGGFRKSVLK